MDTKTKSKTAIIRGRAKKVTNEPVPTPIQHQSPSHTYATIERDLSLDRASFATIAVNSTTTIGTQIASSMESVAITPKQSTFKRIQSLFRPSPSTLFNERIQIYLLIIVALTSSARINRILQTKSTVVAFGSSTPTQRIPPTVLKKQITPAPTAPTTPGASIVKKNPSPKGKYNLRTRLFANPTHAEKEKDEDEVNRLIISLVSHYTFSFCLEKISHQKTVTNTQINMMLDIHLNYLYMCIVYNSLDRLIFIPIDYK